MLILRFATAACSNMAQLENLCAEHGLPLPDRDLYLELAKGKEVDGLRIHLTDFQKSVRTRRYKRGSPGYELHA